MVSPISPVPAPGAAAAAAAAAGKGQAGAALESPRDVLEGPAWSDYQTELLEDLQQPAGGMPSPYPAMLPLDPADVDVYSSLTGSGGPMDCTASSHFDAEGCLQPPHAQLPRALDPQGLGMPGLGLAGLPPGAASPPPCSVDLRGIKVTNMGVLESAVEVLGVNGLLQLVEIWDRTRRRIPGALPHQPQQQQPVPAAAWDVNQLQPAWPGSVPMPDGLHLLPPLLSFGGVEDHAAFCFGDNNNHLYDSQQHPQPPQHQPPQQQQAPTLEDDKSSVLLNFPANKVLRLSAQPSAGAPGDLPAHDGRAAKFVATTTTTTTSFGPLVSARTPSPALPAPVPLDLLGQGLVPHKQPDVPSFVPVAQNGPGFAKSGMETKQQQQQQQLNSRRTRLQLQQLQQERQRHVLQQQQPAVKPSPSPGPAAATTRAARKHRMARQRHSHSFLHHHHLRGSTNSAPTTSPAVSAAASSSVTTATNRMPAPPGGNATTTTPSHPRQSLLAPSRADPARNAQSKHGRNMDGLQFLFQKELKPSDVGSLGRIILPKREAESQLPALNMKDGMPIHAEDFDTGKAWTLKYRYWPNNKSRMYVLECTGEFVKINRLEEGDLMILYRCTSARSKYVLRGKKQSRSSEVATSADNYSESPTKIQREKGGAAGDTDSACTSRTGSSKGSASCASGSSSLKKVADGGARDTPLASKSKNVFVSDPTIIRSGPEDEYLQELTEDPSFEWGGLATLERFPSLEAGDISIDEILGLGDPLPEKA